MTPTSVGWVVVASALGALALGFAAGDNVVVLVGMVLVAPVLVDLWLGRRALDGLDVQRVLPDEIFAGRPARGGIAVRGGRARGLRVTCAGGAVARVDERDRVVPTSWQFEPRGVHAFDGFEVSTRWPLGFFERTTHVPGPVVVVVAPTPLGGKADPNASTRDDVDEGGGRGPLGELCDLRPYAPGDRVRSIHWPTSGRVGEIMVAVRTRGRSDDPIIEVSDQGSRERALSVACGAVIAQKGSYRLVLDGHTFGPDAGAAFRRRMLSALAEAP